MKKNDGSFYMLYDPDDRELPLAVFDTIEEMAEAKKGYELEVGQVLYFACYEPNFPEQSAVSESVVKDISKNGLILVDDCETWVNWKDPDENLFLTQEEAEARIVEMIRNGGH